MANKKARLLAKKIIDGIEYKPNQVIDADVAIIKALVKDGVADDTSEAVKYCIEQGEKPILHKSPDAEAIAALQAEIAKLETELAAAKDADKAAITAKVEAAKQDLQALLA
jgi:peptidyl-tRNA hydrolase